jgi:hypothetical protein
MGPRPPVLLGNRSTSGSRILNGPGHDHGFLPQQHAWEDLSHKNGKEYLVSEYTEFPNVFFKISHNQLSGNKPRRFSTLPFQTQSIQFRSNSSFTKVVKYGGETWALRERINRNGRNVNYKLKEIITYDCGKKWIHHIDRMGTDK